MVVILGFMAYRQAKIIWVNTSEMYNHPFKVSIIIRDIEKDIIAIHRTLKDVILSDNKEIMEGYISEIDKDEARVYENFNIIYEYYLGRKSTIDSSFQAFSEWKKFRDSTIVLCLKGERSEAASMTTNQAEDFMENAVMPSVIKMKNFSENKAAVFYNSAEQTKIQLQKGLFGVVVIFLLVAVLAGIIILRGITSPVNELVEVTERYRKGNYMARSSNDSSNEIGLLARSVNTLAENIQHDLLIKTGIAEISDAIIGKEELMEFCRSVIGVLISKTNSNIGAIYFHNEETKLFEPFFSVGLAADKIKSFSSAFHEGEFGRALLEKKPVMITEIPDDSVFVFEVVAGKIKPREIINIPVFLRDSPVAMISLASLNHYSDEVIELLEVAGKNISMGVNTILAFEKIRGLINKLSTQNEELNALSKELKLQADELLGQNAELDLQKRQIDESNRLKSEFLSSMSHELRTPLNSVIALTGVLSRRLKNSIPEEELGYLEVIERNGKHLLELINDILDLSRIESGKTEIQISKFQVSAMIESILLTFQTQIKDKELRLVNRIGPDLPMLISDKSKCHHIMQNLIGNAIKFTDKGMVEVSSVIRGGEMYLSVKDTGIGIPEDQLPYIFEEFRQVDGTASRRHDGTGLGLAIADRYSRLINARISVKSKPGTGSEFVFIVPLVPPDDLDGDSSDHADPYSSIQTGTSPESEKSDNKERRILIVEDSEPAIIQLSEILNEKGYILNVARSGIEAFDIVKDYKPDGIVLDLMMPGMDGFEVLEKIRGNSDISGIPVLILTAKILTRDELKKLTQNNIHQLIQKGDISKNDLLSSISRMFINKPPATKSEEITSEVVCEKAGKHLILLVEDNQDNVLAIRALIDNKYDLEVATDGPSGVSKAKEFLPDLILLDISLPIIDGFKVFDEIRKEKKLKNIPIIAVTASVMKGNREEMLKFGFDNYISKPVDNVIFNEMLTKYLNPGAGAS